MSKVCDICHDENPTWEYVISAHHQLVGQLMDDTEFIDSGEWLACDLCAALIEKKDVGGLATRGLLNPIICELWVTLPKAGREKIKRRLSALATFLVEHFVQRMRYSQ